MDFGLSKKQVALKKMMGQYFKDKVAPYVEEIDQSGNIPQELIEDFKKMHLFGMVAEEKYGGFGGSNLDYMLVLEELATVWPGGTLFLGTHEMAITVLSLFGNEEQKSKYLPELCSGNSIGSFAFTEASTGSDPRAITTSATFRDGAYFISGTKRFITNPNFGGTMVLFAKTENGVTAFLVDKSAPGYSISQPWDKMGCKGAGLHDVYFKDVKVLPCDIIGKEGKGYEVLLRGIAQGGKLGIISMLLGIGNACIKEAVLYANDRTVRSRPIAGMQHIQGHIAESVVKLEAGRLMAYRAAVLTDEKHGNLELETAKVKLFLSKAVREIASDCLQVHGAYGYIKDFKIERLYRDAKLGEVIEGSSEIQKTIVAKGVM